MTRWILGVAASHNGAVALLRDGEVVAAVQAERLSRRKRQPIRIARMGDETRALIDYCLAVAGIQLSDVEAIAVCSPNEVDTPRFEDGTGQGAPPFVTVPHHLAHAEYAVHYFAGDEATVLICDGSGTYERDRIKIDVQERTREPVLHLRGEAKESISAYRYRRGELELIYRIAYGQSDFAGEMGGKHIGFLASMGHLWRWASWYCCRDHNEAGKVMGLASYGDPKAYPNLRPLALDASTGEATYSFAPLADFDRPNTSGEDVTGDRHYQDIAAWVQASTNVFLLDLVRYLGRLSPSRELCYSGGVALNGLANEYLTAHAGVNLHMNGSCEDNGTAIGAALAVYRARGGSPAPEAVTEFYGRTYPDADVEQMLRKRRIPHVRATDDELVARTADALARGQVVGWHQGRSEFGPRALGHRSILADPRDAAARDKLNAKVKRREAYRPYAPAVLAERASEYFALEGESPVMLRVVPVTSRAIPAVEHVDGTGRVQTVRRETSPRFYDLIAAFGQRTGVPVLLNTSFNIAGEPIVESPEDALNAFIACGMDLLAVGNCIVERASVAALFVPLGPVPQNESERTGARLQQDDLVHRFWALDVDDAEPAAQPELRWLNKGCRVSRDALPLVRRLVKERCFVAGEAAGWAPGEPLDWAEVRSFLEDLIDRGLLYREVPR